MTFRGWAYPSRAIAAAGLLLEALVEPAAPEKAVARDPAERRWQRVPAFLFLRALKPPSA